jgi:(1->4)-alpha-D-glucan 1-alpha-D-glucosylmutase
MEKKGIVDLLNHIADKRKEGLEKLFVTWKALQCRNKLAALFLHGDYHPVYTTQECGIVAYARQYEQQWVLVAAPVSDAIIRGREKELLSGICLSLPFDAPVNWKNEFTGETITVQNNLPLDAVFNAFPVALLTGESNKKNI